MNININNYEEWMIDYLEGNLTRQQEKQLTHFLEAHPELRAELELFQHTKLRPDMNLVFENKEILKKQETGRVITMASWKKYSIGVAAALLLFAGIRFMNTSSPANGVKYEAKQITKPMFAFENKRMEADTAEIITDSIKDKKTDSYFAESGNKKTNDNEEQLKKDG
ncbi:MAG: hypothetical protein H7X71_01920, partial [Chitinophagales bacterium]|nr:hypothetical protein [Chitinophagales bacterium]